MKRKEAIKQIQEGKIQVCNDLLPSTKEIKKFLKEAFPDDEDEFYIQKYFRKLVSQCCWIESKHPKKNLPIINISTITKRKKTKLSQLEKQFSDLAKDVSELRQTIAKDVEVDVEEVKSELIVGEWYDFFNSDYDKEINILNITKIYGEKIWFYGVDYEGNWIDEDWFSVKHNWIKSNPLKVQAALENEAKKRGYNDKVGIKGLNSGEVWTKSGNIEFKYDEKQNT